MAIVYSRTEQNRTITVCNTIPTHSGITGDESINITNGDKYIYKTSWELLNTYVTGGTFSAETLTLSSNDGSDIIVTGFTSSSGSDNYVTGFTYNDANIFTISRNGGLSDLNATINTVTGFTVNGNLIVTGNTQLVNTTGTSFYTDYVDFNNIGASLPTNQQGRIYWDDDNGSLSLGMHGGQVSQQIGLEQYYYIKNQSGATIENGRVVRSAGTLGTSGRILGEYMIADGTIPPKFTLGIATEDIVDGDDGYVTEFGLVRGVNTTGSLYGESWTGGTILWVSPTIPGGLTSVEPQAPNLKIEMAIVINAASNGSMFVRPNRYPYLYDLQEINYSAGTENNLDILQWNSSNLTWDKTNTPSFNSVSATTFYGDGSNLSGTTPWIQSGTSIYYNDGNVGIGVSNPTFNLDIVSSGGTSSFEDIARFRTIDSTDYLAITNAVSTDGSFNPVFRSFNNTNTSTNLYIQSVIDPSVDTGTNALIMLQGRVTTEPGVDPWSGVTTRPIVRVRNNSTNLLDVTADGKVGIGTITPADILEVTDGTTTFATNLDNGSGPIISVVTSDTDNLIRFGATDGTSSINVGTVGTTYSGIQSFGVPSDSYIYSNSAANGLNLINGPGTGTEDYIRFYAGDNALSTSHLHIQGSGSTQGYIGIGTETPTQKLHIYDSVANSLANFESGDEGVNIRFNDSLTTNTPVIGASGNTITFGHISGGDKVSILESGNVGIGTTTPSDILEVVQGTSKFVTDLNNSNGPFINVTTTNTNSLIGFAAGDGTSIMTFGTVGTGWSGSNGFGQPGDSYVYSNSSANGLNIISQPGGTGTEDYIRLYAGGNPQTSIASIHIQGDGSTTGYVGIGTETPSEILEVVQNTERFKLNLNFIDGPQAVLSTTQTDKVSRIAASGGVVGTTMNSIGFDWTGSTVYGNPGDSSIYSNTSANGISIISAPGSGTEDYIRFYAGGNPQTNISDLHIQGDGSTKGYVGFGTETPTQKLHIYDSVTNSLANFESGDERVNIRFNDSLTTNTPVIGASGNTITFGHISGGDKLVIDNNGYVGVGTENPSDRLSVSGSTGQFRARVDRTLPYTAEFYGKTTNSSGSTVMQLINDNVSSIVMGVLGSNRDASVAYGGESDDTFIFASTAANNLHIFNGAGTGTEDSINFYAGNNAAATPHLHIHGSGSTKGYIGIGIGNPQYTLDVLGETRLSGNGQNVLTIIGSGSTDPLFTVQGSAGELFSITDNLTGTLFAVNDISGLPILEVNSDDEILMGNYQAPSLNTTFKTSITSGLTELYSIPLSAYTGGFFEYTLTGTGARAGSIVSIFSGSSVNYTETTTTDIGDTSPITFDMNVSGGTANLTVSATTGTWEIKTIVRSI